MWADESMTAVGAQRVLQFGYPKVHDGRNVFYDLRHRDLTLGVEPRSDAYIGGAGWLQYYFAAPFVALSAGVADLYWKTALLRIPFALAGFIGLLLLLRLATRVFPDHLSRLGVATVFVLLLIPSITLIMHLREVRYYSLQLLLTTIALGLFASFHLRRFIQFKTYLIGVVVLIPALFLTFAPAAVAFCAAICLYLLGEWLADLCRAQTASKTFENYSRPLVAVVVGEVAVIPLAWFFRTLSMTRQLADYYGYSFDIYLQNLGVVWGYFTRYDILVFVIAGKVLLLVAWRQLRADRALHPALRLSLFLTIYCLVHALCIGQIPNRLFTRYFITLQPLLVLVFALDQGLLAHVVAPLEGRRRRGVAGITALLLISSLTWSYSRNLPFIEGRLYEMTNRYMGVLDYVIPYLDEQFPDPSRLIIATNYEETSYIFYLGSRVMIGFLNPDLDEDLQRGLPEQPDAIIFRRFWGNAQTEEIFNFLLARANYQAVTFPVFDYGFNNIPEVVHWTPETGWEWGLHYFATETTTDPDLQTILFLRENAR
jgi:hypothetical protein